MSNEGVKGRLTVIGYGFHEGHLTMEALWALKAATKLFYQGHPSPTLQRLSVVPPEDVYDYSIGQDERSDRYEQMIETVLAAVRQGHNVVLACYGSASTGVYPSHKAIERAREEGYQARMLPGISSLEMAYCDLGIDPAAQTPGGHRQYGLTTTLADVWAAEPWRFSPMTALLLLQVSAIGIRGDADAAMKADSVERLALLLERVYGRGHEVKLYHAGRSSEPMLIRTTPIDRLPHQDVGNWTGINLYVPPISAEYIGGWYAGRRDLCEKVEAVAGGFGVEASMECLKQLRELHKQLVPSTFVRKKPPKD
jgi:hypothetical protein